MKELSLPGFKDLGKFLLRRMKTHR